MNRAVFLDRDGVINRKAPEGEYITSWGEMQFLPGVAGALRSLNLAKFLVIVVSNQRCVGNELLTDRDLKSIHKRMRNELAADDARIDAIYYCPHGHEAACDCRKPAPGMLLQAARDCHIDLTASWMIGDSAIDVEAGRKAGCKTARILNGEGLTSDADVVARSLFDVVEQILQRERASIPRAM